MRKVYTQVQAKQSVEKPQRTVYVISWVRRMSVWHSRPKGTNGGSRYKNSDWAHVGLQEGLPFGPGTHPAPGENNGRVKAWPPSASCWSACGAARWQHYLEDGVPRRQSSLSPGDMEQGGQR